MNFFQIKIELGTLFSLIELFFVIIMINLHKYPFMKWQYLNKSKYLSKFIVIKTKNYRAIK